MNTFPETDVNSLDPKNREQVIRMATELLKRNNLTGRAEIYLHEAEAMKRIWRQIADKSRAYFLGDVEKGPGFVVIHTKIEKIECTIPRARPAV